MWQIDPHGRARSYLTFNIDGAAVSLDDFLTDHQSKTRPFAGRFGGHEKIENFRQQFCRYARAIVRNLYVDPWTFSLAGSAGAGGNLQAARLPCSR